MIALSAGIAAIWFPFTIDQQGHLTGSAGFNERAKNILSHFLLTHVSCKIDADALKRR